MQIYVDLDTRKLRKSVSNSAPVTQLDFKRGDDETVEIFYVRANTQVQLAVGVVVTFGAKIKDQYDGTALVYEDGFTLSGTGVTAKYSANPSFNTVPLDAALMVDANPANDKRLLDLMGEITWNEGGTITSSVTFAVRVNNDVLRGDEATPTALPDPAEWMPGALTYAGANPNSGGSAGATVTGTLGYGTDSIVFPTLLPIADLFSRPAYSGIVVGEQVATCDWDGSMWFLRWGILDVGWLSSDDVATPDLVTTWTPIDADPGDPEATGTPVVTISAGDAPVATHLGQLCRASTAWWIWNGTAWIPWATLNGSPIAYNATLSAYRKLTVSGADGSEIITISAL